MDVSLRTSMVADAKSEITFRFGAIFALIGWRVLDERLASLRDPVLQLERFAPSRKGGSTTRDRYSGRTLRSLSPCLPVADEQGQADDDGWVPRGESNRIS